jgi:hypothetical protein
MAPYTPLATFDDWRTIKQALEVAAQTYRDAAMVTSLSQHPRQALRAEAEKCERLVARYGPIERDRSSRIFTGAVRACLVFAVVTLFASSSGAQAQASVSPGDRFAWNMAGPGIEAVRSYRYEVEVDGRRLPEPLAGVECDVIVTVLGEATNNPEPFECTGPIPTAVGSHALRVRSIDVSVPGLSAIEGAWSPLFAYVMRPVPPAPMRLRVVKPRPKE